MKRQFRVWILRDAEGNEIARGRKRDVVNVSYHRYVYQHIFTDVFYISDERIEA